MKVAIIGASGAVGRTMLTELERCGFRGKIELGLFASPRSAGQELKFGDQALVIEEFKTEKLSGYQFAMMSAGGAFSREFAQAIADQGCTVIDNSSAWRMTAGVPLVVPEVNADALGNNSTGIVANPNCSTIQMVVSLKPLQDHFGLRSVNVSTYQSVSGSGQAGMDELTEQLHQWAQNKPLEPQKYSHPIANNLIPAIDVMGPDGHCFEEEKMVRETRKILGLKDLNVLATTVRVPVLKCHSESITVELEKSVSRDEVNNVFRKAEGITLGAEDDYQHFAFPQGYQGRPDVAVCRVRLPLGQASSHTVQYWNVADNLMKGAATNAVQILERLMPGA